jgi:hypothetical protein
MQQKRSARPWCDMCTACRGRARFSIRLHCAASPVSTPKAIGAREDHSLHYELAQFCLFENRCSERPSELMQLLEIRRTSINPAVMIGQHVSDACRQQVAQSQSLTGSHLPSQRISPYLVLLPRCTANTARSIRQGRQPAQPTYVTLFSPLNSTPSIITCLKSMQTPLGSSYMFGQRVISL